MEQSNQFDPSILNNLLQDSTTSLIPESLITTITTGFLVLSILGGLFLVLYLFSIIRKWRVDSAILQMQKDVAEIKGQLLISTPKQIDSNPDKELFKKSSNNI
ncbi:MAG: hypothetical protein ABIR46_03785 [Candidatus Saccharimonadales bacterium]